MGTETFALSSGNSFGYDGRPRHLHRRLRLSRTWQLRQLAYVLDNFSHVLCRVRDAAVRPPERPVEPTSTLAELDAAGIALALAFHGSEIRDPAAQRERVPFSPFDPDHELTRALQSKVDRLGPVVRDLDLPKFVSTPDLLHDVPGADWLPVVVDPGLWASDRVPLERDRPVVVHAPSSPFTKGTALIEPVVEELHDAGLIEYRRIKGVSHADMPAVLADADIVLDQFVFGAYGVMSVQALAAGRVTLCYLHESVTQYLPDGLPIVNRRPGHRSATNWSASSRNGTPPAGSPRAAPPTCASTTTAHAAPRSSRASWERRREPRNEPPTGGDARRQRHHPRLPRAEGGLLGRRGRVRRAPRRLRPERARQPRPDDAHRGGRRGAHPACPTASGSRPANSPGTTARPRRSGCCGRRVSRRVWTTRRGGG
ncbi:hypothetical protein ACU686_07265 [Yinghuangia aomiensis]